MPMLMTELVSEKRCVAGSNIDAMMVLVEIVALEEMPSI